MINVLIDLNVCLDLIFNSGPFAAPAQEISERSEHGEFNAYVAAHGFDTIDYVLKKRIGQHKATEAVKDIRKAFDVAPVTESIIDDAIDAGWNDFEDAIHYHTARAAGCEAIITRNGKDFKQSGLPVLSPQRFLDQLRDKNETE